MYILPVLLLLSAPSFRDVVATAWDHPLICDAEMVERLGDDTARVRVSASPLRVRYPGVNVVRVDGQPVRTARLAPDLVSLDLPTGEYTIAAGRDAPASEDTVAPGTLDGDGLVKLVEAARPGDTVTIPDGLYRDFRATLKTSGTAAAPVTIRAATPGGAIFVGNTALVVAADHVTVSGLRFEQCGPGTTVLLSGGSGCRLTQCLFIECGNPESTFNHIVSTDGNGEANRVDHCYFTGCRSMACGVRVREGSSPKRQRIDHNIFRDTYRYWVNGQENVQLGQNQRGKVGEERPEATVEFNLFDQAWGDGEIISSKSTGNAIRHNVAAWCWRSAFTLRGGDLARFEGNAIVGGGGGLRVMGKRHTIVNNLFAGVGEPAIYFETGSADGENQVATEDTIAAFNTFVDCPTAFGAMPTNEARPHAPRRLQLRDNLAIGINGEPLALADAKEVATSRFVNLPAPDTELPAAERYAAWLAGSVPLPAAAIDQGQAVPQVTVDLLARPRQGAPDVGAFEAGAGPAQVHLPPLPPKPLIDPSLYRGRQLLAEANLPATETTITAQPASQVVLTWSYHPDSYAATAWLAIGGYKLSWGGADKDGKPLGVIRLTKGPQVVATAADLVHYRQDFIYQGWMNRTVNEAPAPAQDAWYRFQLVKDRGRMFLTMASTRYRLDLPLLSWRDRSGQEAAGPLAIGGDGPGQFGEVRLYEYDYAGARPPDEPSALRAEAMAGRVRLAWTEAPRDAGAVTYRLTRTVRGQGSLVMAGFRGSLCDDFAAPAGVSCRWTLVAENRFGLQSQPLTVEFTPPADAPFGTAIEAAAARLEPPFILVSDASGLRYATAGNIAAAMQGAPEQGVAEFKVTLPQASEVVIYGLVTAADDGHDSFYLAIDDEPYAVWYTGVHATWAWSRARQVKLTAGEHTLRVKYREPGTAVARLVVTADTALAPAP